MSGILRKAHPPVDDDSTPPAGESMLAIAQVLAMVSMVALVTSLVTSHDVFAWLCSGMSALGVALLIIDAIRDRRSREDSRAGAESPIRPHALPARDISLRKRPSHTVATKNGVAE